MIPRVCLSLLLLPWMALAQLAGKEGSIVVFGDSITEGGTLPQALRELVWVRQVERELGGSLQLINEGKACRQTGSVTEFEQMLSRQPRMDALVIALGMNDSRDISADCVTKAVSNVAAMIQKARFTHGAGLPVLLVGPANIHTGARAARLRALGEAFARLAADTRSEFVSLDGVVPASSLLHDGVHPDAVGNAAIARVMTEKLRAWPDGHGK
jgi:acyl-CoA thioesterase-1